MLAHFEIFPFSNGPVSLLLLCFGLGNIKRTQDMTDRSIKQWKKSPRSTFDSIKDDHYQFTSIYMPYMWTTTIVLCTLIKRHSIVVVGCLYVNMDHVYIWNINNCVMFQFDLSWLTPYTQQNNRTEHKILPSLSLLFNDQSTK